MMKSDWAQNNSPKQHSHVPKVSFNRDVHVKRIENRSNDAVDGVKKKHFFLGPEKFYSLPNRKLKSKSLTRSLSDVSSKKSLRLPLIGKKAEDNREGKRLYRARSDAGLSSLGARRNSRPALTGILQNGRDRNNSVHLHPSQMPVEKPRLTKGMSVDGIVKRLSQERFSPPPFISSPSFSYIGPNDYVVDQSSREDTSSLERRRRKPAPRSYKREEEYVNWKTPTMERREKKRIEKSPPQNSVRSASTRRETGEPLHEHSADRDYKVKYCSRRIPTLERRGKRSPPQNYTRGSSARRETSYDDYDDDSDNWKVPTLERRGRKDSLSLKPPKKPARLHQRADSHLFPIFDVEETSLLCKEFISIEKQHTDLCMIAYRPGCKAERNIDDGSHFDAKRFEQHRRESRPSISHKPPFENNKKNNFFSGFRKVKSLFSEGRKSQPEIIPLQNGKIEYDISMRRRLSTPKASPLLKRGPSLAADLHSKNRRHKSFTKTSTLTREKSKPSLRYFGDTDLESDNHYATALPEVDNAVFNTNNNNSKSKRDDEHSTTDGETSNIIYLHAMTIGAIPQASTENGSCYESDIRSLKFRKDKPMTRTVSRSLSMSAPWQPKFISSGYNIYYNKPNPKYVTRR